MKDMPGMKAPKDRLTDGSGTSPPSAKESHSEHAAEVWTCPMHPQTQKPGPGECPICHMDLVRKEPGK